MALITPIGTLATRGKALLTASKSKEDKAKADAPLTFYARVLFTPDALKSKEWAAIVAAITEAGTEKFGKNFAAMWKEGGIRSPLRRDVATKGYDSDTFAGFIQVKAWEDNPPAVLSRFAGADGKPKKIVDASEFRPGTLVRLSVAVRAYGGGTTGFSPGIALDFRAVQKMGEGSALVGGAGDATDGLDALPEEADSGDDAAAMAEMLKM